MMLAMRDEELKKLGWRVLNITNKNSTNINQRVKEQKRYVKNFNTKKGPVKRYIDVEESKQVIANS